MIHYTQSPLLTALHGLVPQPPAQVRGYLCSLLISALDHYYVHLPQKRAAFAIDPVRELQLLRASDGSDFVRKLLQIFASLRDRHTTLKLAEPWRSLVAYVPFVLERFFLDGQPRYVVTRQMFGFEEIPIGAEVTHWNGIAIERYVRRQMMYNQGGNVGAQIQLAVANLCIRPLSFLLVPDEDWVTLNYVDLQGTRKAHAVPWRFFSQAAPMPSAGLANQGEALAGIDELSYLTNRFRSESQTRSNLITMSLGVEMDGQLRFGTIINGRGKAAYIRLTSFEVPDPTGFVRRLADILATLPQDGLVIDVRQNPGGQIPAGQKFIRLLTKNNIEPSPLAFRNTASTMALGSIPLFARWAPSLNIQWHTGEVFSQSLPVTTYEDVPDYRYPGKVVLIVDGLCYSTTDFFAADFADNCVGTIIGVDGATGGGGANVWGWSLLSQFLGSLGPGPLPPEYDLNIAMRRSVRTGPSGGIPVEDLGVSVNVVYRITKADVLEANRDLLAFAMAQLRATQ